ncbi:hypothetical protein CI102_6559 [Trichoderma harzianum]|nr:hypothetical protein CI102_6559 [Trichoderma harzianum]
MSAPVTSRDEARKLVQSIAQNHGYVDEDDWKLVPSDVRERLQNAVGGLQGIAGVTISTLATNIYTSDARFVFELLQNAEDNSFHKAREANLTRYVSFEVHPDHIITECNEDGFESKNLKAICDIGQSSKTGVQNGYIGQKGIGFKSVFKVAWKVYIQSGNFSFAFEHRNGDNGLGMIRPIWCEPGEGPPHPTTRMKLLLGDGRSPILPSDYDIILDQFNSLNENILLFMRNLEEIRISIFDNEGKMVKSHIFSKLRISANVIRVTKSTNAADSIETGSKDYYIFKHNVENLDKHDNRIYSEDEEATKAYASAEIFLGFPLTEESIPIVEYEHIFAYLPMKQAGFTFLINSDFVTQANRQDIVMTSRRNLGLRKGIVEAFIQAIMKFCDHPKLQYTWMRFLPRKDQHYDAFWSQLVILLEERLKETPVLRPIREDSLRSITSLHFPLSSQLDRHGNPLFEDIYRGAYISKQYNELDIKTLRSYGLTEYPMSYVLSALSLYSYSAESKLRSKDADDDWHTRASKYLSSMLHESWYKNSLCSFPLLPLQDGTWIAPDDEEVVFPETNGLEIPPEVNLKIIDSKAAHNVHRRHLFHQLGVREVEISYLRLVILASGFRVTALSSSFKQLQFMFLTDKHRGLWENKENILIVDSEGQKQSAYVIDVYMPDSGNIFGPSELLGKVKRTDGMYFKFLHHSCMGSIFEKEDENLIRSWKDWLCSYAGVRRHIRIISQHNTKELSKECLYIAANHADKFLGYLRYSWKHEHKTIESTPGLIRQLKRVVVPCYGGKSTHIKFTYLPLPNLQRQWERFSRGSEDFPFIKLDKEITRETYVQDWGFLVSCLSVGVEDNIRFYLWLLFYIMSHHKGGDIDDAPRIVDLYKYIYNRYVECDEDEKKKQKEYIRNLLIYVPKTKYSASSHISPKDCVWDGPESLTNKAPLLARYQAMSINTWYLSSIESFMTSVLDIGHCNEGIICDQLDDLRSCGSNDFDRIKGLYTSLWGMLRKKKLNDSRELMNKFADKALIYTKSDNCWSKISQCLWSNSTIRSKKALESDYNELKMFFVDILGVETLNLGVIYRELSRLGESTPTVELVKEQLFAFKDHLHTIDNYKNISPDEMRKLTIFPVRYPGAQQDVRFCDGNAEFAIADRRPLEESFQQKIKMLGFAFDEVHSLGPVIRWLALEERYLSCLVTETSKVEDDDRVPDHALSHSIESRALALCRIVKHFNFPRWRTNEDIHKLYYLLKQAKVFETDKISCIQLVQQGGQSYSHEISRGKFHLEESGNNLDIFVPLEQKSRALCLARDLPARLFKWMTTNRSVDDPSSINERSYSLIKDILKEDSYAYNHILFEEGIIEITIEGEELSGEDSISISSVTGDASELRGSTEIVSDMSTPSTDISSPRTIFDHDEIRPTVVHQDTTVSISRFASSPSANRLFIQETSSNASAENVEVSTSIQRESLSVDLGYFGLLSHVVSAARRASFPTKGIFDLDTLRESLPSLSSVSGIQYYEKFAGTFPQLERDKMIGAAGELYVFELLKACNPSLPDFGIDNWKSKIRSYAKKHPEYASMLPWYGRETSDLVYHDKMGTFTKLLIDNCYFDASTWEHRRPTYHFEVKTTVSSCETRFFVSKNQYKMVRTP